MTYYLTINIHQFLLEPEVYKNRTLLLPGTLSFVNIAAVISQFCNCSYRFCYFLQINLRICYTLYFCFIFVDYPGFPLFGKIYFADKANIREPAVIS
jgi:hypothetical protein